MARCPNCNKMVSLENGDPEVENLEVEFDGERNFMVSGSIRLTRNCADCSETLKELSDNLEYTADLKGFEWKLHGKPWTPPDLELVAKELKNSSNHALNVEAAEANVDETGGGRFKKNFIEVVVPFTITVELDSGVEGTYNADIKLSNPAGSYEECC